MDLDMQEKCEEENQQTNSMDLQEKEYNASKENFTSEFKKWVESESLADIFPVEDQFWVRNV
jgi:hypothetical protein